MKALYYCILLQRRRLIIGAVLLLVAELLRNAAIDGYPVWVAFQKSFLFAFVGLMIAVVAIRLFPHMRQSWEIIGFTLVFITLCELFFSHWVPKQYAADLFWRLAGFYFAYLVLYQIVYGVWWHKLNQSLSLVSTAQILVNASAKDVWHVLIPDEQEPERYFSGRLLSFVNVDHPEATHAKRTKYFHGSILEDFVKVTRKIEFSEFSYLAWSVEEDATIKDKDKLGVDIDLIETAHGTLVRYSEKLVNLDPATLLLVWMDNPMKELLVCLQSKVEGTSDPTEIGKIYREIVGSN